jgi:uncharacterized protein (TIGR00730 family)
MMSDDVWRIFRVMAELVDGFETLSKVGPCVAIFGSARTAEDHPHYKLTVDVGRAVAQAGYGVISGGGPGIMEAANKGAYEIKGAASVGLNIMLPFEQTANPYQNVALHFRHFFVRKVMFLKYTSAVIVMPGGYGTLDELFEVLTLVQTEKIHPTPVVLMGKEFWAGLLDWLDAVMLKKEKYISDNDITSLIHITDDPDEAVSIIKKYAGTGSQTPNPV